jgi:hypothetical protein
LPEIVTPTGIESGTRLKAIRPAAAVWEFVYVDFLQAVNAIVINKKPAKGIRIENCFFMVKNCLNR